MAAKQWLSVVVPGILSGLTNTDVAAVVTFTQSGASFGLASLKFQVLCIPFMYCFQELGARLGTVTRRGLLTAAREELGVRASTVAFICLLIVCFATLFCEAAGVAAVARLWSFPQYGALVMYAGLLLYTTLRRSVVTESLSLVLAALLAFFVALAGLAVADRRLGQANSGSVNLGNSNFDLLVLSATVGSALTPFLLYYQSAASKDANQLPILRLNILLGVVIAVVCSIAVTVSATFEFWHYDHRTINTIQDCGLAFSNALGLAGTVIFSLGLAGAAMTSSSCTLATIVFAFTDSFGDDEIPPELTAEAQPLVRKPEPPLNEHGPIVLCVVMLSAVITTVLCTTEDQQIKLEVFAQDLDCIALPPALYLALFLARRLLPRERYSHREFVFHVAGSTIVSLFALLPVLAALLIKIDVL